MTPSEWRVYFRISESVFAYIASAIERHPLFVRPSSVGARKTSVKKLLAIWLYTMGCASVQLARVASEFEVSPNTVVRAMRDIPTAINACLGDNIAWPAGAVKEKVKKEFADAGFPEAVGVVDCTHWEVVPPAAARRNGTVNAFVSRKSRMTKVYQLVVGLDLTIFDVAGGHPGSVSDITVWKDSAISDVGRYFVGREYLLADCGYPVRSYMTRPFKDPEIAGVRAGGDSMCADAMRYYNKRFSGVRITVERAIGVLKVRPASVHLLFRPSRSVPTITARTPSPLPLQARFRALHFETWYRDTRKYSAAFAACCVIHNVCIKMGDFVSSRDIDAALRLEEKHREEVRQLDAEAAAAGRDDAVEAGVGGGIRAGRELQARLFYLHQTLCLPQPWNYRPSEDPGLP